MLNFMNGGLKPLVFQGLDLVSRMSSRINISAYGLGNNIYYYRILVSAYGLDKSTVNNYVITVPIYVQLFLKL